jgi:hypothetical protein
MPLQAQTTDNEPERAPEQTRKEINEQKQKKSKQKAAADKSKQPKQASSGANAKQPMDTSKRQAALTAVKGFVADHCHNDSHNAGDARELVTRHSPAHDYEDALAAVEPRPRK